MQWHMYKSVDGQGVPQPEHIQTKQETLREIPQNMDKMWTTQRQ